uniref:AraC family transcriptional regulator n=1 Tax=Steinernema glaseri TaxID=37863 RepID=A0A1I7ZR40_9BILA
MINRYAPVDILFFHGCARTLVIDGDSALQPCRLAKTEKSRLLVMDSLSLFKIYFQQQLYRQVSIHDIVFLPAEDSGQHIPDVR